jgi:hypothetical protein
MPHHSLLPCRRPATCPLTRYDEPVTITPLTFGGARHAQVLTFDR